MHIIASISSCFLQKPWITISQRNSIEIIIMQQIEERKLGIHTFLPERGTHFFHIHTFLPEKGRTFDILTFRPKKRRKWKDLLWVYHRSLSILQDFLRVSADALENNLSAQFNRNNYYATNRGTQIRIHTFLPEKGRTFLRFTLFCPKRDALFWD